MNSSSTAKTVLFWISIVFLGVMLWRLVSNSTQTAREDNPSYSEFVAKVDDGDVKEVTMYLSPNSYELRGEYAKPANHKFVITVPKENAPDLTKLLHDKAVQMNVKEVRSSDWVLDFVERVATAVAGWICVLPDAADAGRRKQGIEFWEVAGAVALGSAEESHVQGCGGQRRSKRRAAGNH